ncbi:hypothetical protein SDJN03_21036, partial [Cucurbita argyrosperma subsp. sororia]
MNKKNFGFSFAIGFRGQLIAFFEQLESCTLLLYFILSSPGRNLGIVNAILGWRIMPSYNEIGPSRRTRGADYAYFIT